MLSLATAEDVAFVSAGATIAAAMILGGWAAWAADRRQRRQINDASDRQARELEAQAERQQRELADAADRQRDGLEAEAERQSASLAHDRELADLADLRALLDEASLALNLARDARDDIDVGLTEHGQSLPHDRKAPLAERGRDLLALNARLLVRLGKDDPLASAFAEANDALERTWRQVAHLEDDNPASLVVKRQIIADEKKRFSSAVDEFMRHAVYRAGVTMRE